MSGDPESEALLRSLAQQGVTAEGAIPAFQGLYPAFRGRTNLGLIATRQRALTFHGNSMRSWSRYSGMQITAPLRSFERASLRLGLGQGNYSRLISDTGAKFWIDGSWEAALSEWLDGTWLANSPKD
ncbi:MAG: hypothetical protein QOE71_3226 [Pseudonocardiales bacterium]|nr:hypothetical protein [Pseudonocardiales bacterium]